MQQEQGTAREYPNRRPRRAGRAALLAAGLLLGGARVNWHADEPEVTRLNLRARALCGDPPRLADVLSLSGADATLLQQIGEQPLFARPPRPFPATVTHDQVVRRLGELGVNLSRVLVGGAATCQLQTARPDSGVRLAADVGPDPEPGRATPAADGVRTLADVIRVQIDAELAKLGGKGQVQFALGGQEYLQLTAPPWEFQVTGTGHEKLGLREFQVLVRGEGQKPRKVPVYAQVQLVRPVVTARRPLNPGNVVGHDDVAVESRVFDRAPTGPTQVGEVVGQQVRKFVPAGNALTADAIRAGDLVARGRPVTVLNGESNVQVRLTGVALDAGALGDTVRVRMGDGSRGRTLLHGVVTGMGTVKLLAQ